MTAVNPLQWWARVSACFIESCSEHRALFPDEFNTGAFPVAARILKCSYMLSERWQFALTHLYTSPRSILQCAFLRALLLRGASVLADRTMSAIMAPLA
eukprot:6172118-Pleurochrysis_carterae.AAC.1